MWSIEPDSKIISYDDITVEQLRQWARAVGIVVVKIKLPYKRPWLASKMHEGGVVETVYKGRTEKDALWAVYRQQHPTQ